MKVNLVFYCGDLRYEHCIPEKHLAKALIEWRKYSESILNLAKNKIGYGATFCRLDKITEVDTISENIYSKRDIYKVPDILALML